MSANEHAELVRTEHADGAARITLDSPANRNALSSGLVDGLRTALAEADRDPAVRLVVLGHTGNTFCAGADLSEVTGASLEEANRARGTELLSLLRDILALRAPVVAQVEGHVRAGGMGLVAACDLAVAGPTSSFALTESRLGLAAAVVSTVVRPRLSDRDAAVLFLTGRRIDAAEAARIGFVTDAPQDAAGAVRELVEEFRAVSPQGLAESKALLNRALLQRFDADAEHLLEQSARLFASDEAREGMTAFLEKRPPRWATA